MYVLYSLLLGGALLLATPWWLLQMARHAKYRAGLAQRLGRIPGHVRNAQQPTIWIHAVSVGEVLAISTLVKQLRERHPDHRVFISTTTATGYQLAGERFGTDYVFFFPLDFAFCVRPYLRALKPALVILAETEFWPNFLRLASASGARIAVVNARISDRSLPRYRRFRSIFRRVLQSVNVFLAQSDEDARRLVVIGAEPTRVHVGGNLKFEVAAAPNGEIVDRLRQAFLEVGAGPLIVAGSTVEGEEALVLKALEEIRTQFPKMAAILAPRHRERFPVVGKLLSDSSWNVVRRSEWSGEALVPGTLLLLDTIGELASLYAIADLAFVGGSLVPRGGHNILEPAQFGKPIVIGPHHENFRDIITIFRRADAVRIVDSQKLATEFVRILNSDSELGARAAEVIRAQSGATERTLMAIDTLLEAR